MAYERRTFSGGVPATTLNGGIDGSTLTITIADATSWPTGSAGDFAVIIDRGNDSEEKVLIDSRSGTTLTVASGGRGVDGTSGIAHSSGATIEHSLLARDVDEPNAHIADTGLDHHTQYLNTARHDVEARHTFGGAYGTPGAAADIGTAAATGSGDNPAREDHVHQIGTGAIDTSTQFAAGVVDAAAIATDAVGTAEIAALAVTASELASNAVTTAKILDANVTTGKLADDAVTAAKLADGAIDAAAKVDDGVLTLVKMASEGASTWVPTFGGLTGSSNTIYGRYFKVGRIVFGWAGFTIGTGGNVTSAISISLPVAAADEGAYYLVAARARAATSRATGIGIIAPGTSVGINIATIGTDLWDGTNPFNWDVNNTLDAIIVYEAAS